MAGTRHWELKQELAAQIMSHGDSVHTEELENTCWQLLLPYLARWLEQVPSTTYPFGCWNQNVDDNRPSHLNIHFLNAFQPDPPFTDYRRDVISSLLTMLEHGVKENPQATHIWCDSWLNQFEPFNALFPPAWAESFAPTYYFATYGWWGQYMDHRGAFHNARAEKLRHTGQHPYAAGQAECNLTEAIEHLSALVG